jgi:hypothetical protein
MWATQLVESQPVKRRLGVGVKWPLARELVSFQLRVELYKGEEMATYFS